MRAPEFAAYIHPARQYPELWRILLGILLTLFIYLACFALMLVVLYPIIGPLEYFGWLLGLQSMDQAPQTLFLLLSFAGLFLGTILAAAALHGRGPGTLFGPGKETLRAFCLTLMALVPLYAVMLAVSWQFSPAVPNLPLDAWLRYLPWALLLLLVQITAEELLFRGYLQQQLAVRFQARWIWMGMPALGFTLMHWNPEAGGNLWAILFVIFCFALIAADLTERSGNLGAALGVHFVNNIAALLVVSVDGSITGLALYVTPFGIDDTSALPMGLGVDLLLLFVVWRLLRALIVR